MSFSSTSLPGEVAEEAPSRRPSYYVDVDVADDFLNFDDPLVYHSLQKRAGNSSASNFVLDFGQEHAWCGFDVSAATLSHVLDERKGRPAECDTRWIQIWGPNRQQAHVQALAKKYGFTPRLTGLMRASPHKRPSMSRTPSKASGLQTRPSSMLSLRQRQWGPRRDRVKTVDPEKSKAFRVKGMDAEEDMLGSLNHYDIVQQIYHWSSVDLGEKYFCLGFNSLHISNKRGEAQTPAKKKIPGTSQQRVERRDLPDGQRLWSWLILCHDKTIIFLTEDTTAQMGPDVDVSALRRNMLNVFSQLSAASDPTKQNPISLVPIRRHNTASDSEDFGRPLSDAPGLLFYYLFDDWGSSYSLVAGHEHRYGMRLRELREEMLEKADIEHINELHHIGRQLSVMRRLYKSYELLIDRLLGKRTPPTPPTRRIFSHPMTHLESSNNNNNDSSEPDAAISAGPHASDQLGVYLTPAARVRFERLRDRIGLYALAEIDECDALAGSLADMNYSLIGMRQGTYVEKLTRITILLSKATLLFLPVSLLTAYGSVPDSNVSIRAYWIAFAVLMATSFVLILAFGVISQTLEGKMIYVGIWQRVWAALTGVETVGKRVIGLDEQDGRQKEREE